MDLSILINIVRTTFLGDNNLRNQAEEHLRTLRDQPKFLQALLEIIYSNQNDPNLCKACSIFLKNTINMKWDNKFIGERVPISEEDKAVVKSKIIFIIAHCQHPPVVKFLSMAARIISVVDFPTNWPELFPEILSYFSNPDLVKMSNVMTALRYIIGIYCFRRDEKRGDLPAIADTLLPCLYMIANRIIPSYSNIAGEILNNIAKIFSHFNVSFEAIHMANMERFDQWMTLFKRILDIPLGTVGMQNCPIMPQDQDEQMSWSWFKIKKWIYASINKIFHSYGLPKITTNESFAEKWIKTYSVPFLESTLIILKARDIKNHAQDYLTNVAISYINSAIRIAYAYQYIYKELNFILQDVIFINIRMTEDDIELWRDDPIEYVRQDHDFSKEITSPRIAAHDLLRDLAKYRGKDVLDLLMNSFAHFLKLYKEGKNTDFLMKDVVMQELGFLAENILSKKAYRSSIEALMMNYIFPEFDSPFGVLRGRACWVLERYANYEFKNENLIQIAVNGMIRALNDQEIPVKILASSAIGTLVNNGRYKVYFQPKMREILEIFLNLIVAVGVSELSDALQCVLTECLDKLSDDLPLITSQILQAFIKYSKSEDEEEIRSALGYLSNIGCICSSVCEVPETLNLLEPIVLDTLIPYLTSEFFVFEYFEDIIDVLSIFSYYTPTFSDRLWSVYPVVIYLISSQGIDFLAGAAALIENYISRSTDQFVLRSFNYNNQVHTASDILLEFVTRSLTSDINDLDGTFCCFLYMSFLINCPSKIDAAIPNILKAVLLTLNKLDVKQQFQLSLIEVIETCLCVNFKVSYDILFQINQLDTFVIGFLNASEFHKTKAENCLIILFLIQLFSLDISFWTKQLIDNQSNLFSALIAAYIKNSSPKDESDDNDVSDNEYLQSAYNEDDFGFDKEADAIDNYETTYVHECINKFTEEAFDSDFYDFNQSDVEGFIDGIYKYPINQQFLQAMKNFSESSTERYNQIITSLKPEQQQQYREVIMFATNNK